MHSFLFRLIFSLVFALCVCSSALSQAAIFVPRLQPFLTGLTRPVLLTNAKDGSRRIFILQQGGIIKVIQHGASTSTDFINLSSKIVVPISPNDERGLLGLTFHPQFSVNGKFYVDYTRVGDGATVIAEYKLANGNPNQGDVASERILLTIPQPFTNHNGGMVEFGADGFLYIGMGDGGSANDPGARAQNRAQLLGKMLRIDVNIPDGSQFPYLIPPNNPFTGANTARCDGGSTTAGNTCQEIWAIGMRNPWRWSFDRGGTRQLYAADVGQGAIEELDIINGGANYGWRVYEGNNCTNLDPSLCIPGNFTMPFFTYSHTAQRCSVTGGYVYRGLLGNLPTGAYTFADYCTGEIWMWNNNQQVLIQDTTRNVVSFGEDEAGEIYVCFNNGTIDKITTVKAPFDFDGDRKTEIGIFRPVPAEWWYQRSSNSTVFASQFGSSTDNIAPADFTGDAKSDIAFFRPSTGEWFILRSEDYSFYAFPFGASGDIPVPADYDGDAKADAAVFRPSSTTWFVSKSSGGTLIQQFGAPSDLPVPSDYDGDGKSDLAIYRANGANQEWWYLKSTNSAVFATVFGTTGDKAVPGDYTGDGKSDIAFFRPSTGNWFVLRSEDNSFYAFPFGASGDLPAPGDYDGDGKFDAAVFRASSATWFLNRSTAGVQIVGFGASTDQPLPGAYVR